MLTVINFSDGIFAAKLLTIHIANEKTKTIVGIINRFLIGDVDPEADVGDV